MSYSYSEFHISSLIAQESRYVLENIGYLLSGNIFFYWVPDKVNKLHKNT